MLFLTLIWYRNCSTSVSTGFPGTTNLVAISGLVTFATYFFRPQRSCAYKYEATCVNFNFPVFLVDSYIPTR